MSPLADAQILVDLIQILRSAKGDSVAGRKFGIAGKGHLNTVGETRRVRLVEIKGRGWGSVQRLKIEETLISKFCRTEEPLSENMVQVQQYVVILVLAAGVISSIGTTVICARETVSILVRITAEELSSIADVPVDPIYG